MKNYITKAYVDMLRDKDKSTGVYFNTPKVIKRGEKYRKALSLTQKNLYEEFWDLAMRAAHKNQIDEDGRVYVEVSYSYMAVALDISEGTTKFNMNGTGNKAGKYTELFTLGLIRIKKRKDRETSQYYVMAPVYEGEDVAFLTNDITTSSMKSDAKEMSAKRNKNSKSKRETENEQLKDEKAFDTRADNAEYEVIEREIVNNTPDFIEPVKKDVVAEQTYYFKITDRQDGFYSAFYICEQKGRIVGSWPLKKFVQMKKLNINCNRHESEIMKDIEALGEYKLKWVHSD